jgi:hypothetical protein
MEIFDKEKFAEEFMNRYAQRGFGSMNKSDFEILIFDLLRKYGDLKDKTQFEISIDLQISDSKVRRLSYESDLKYGQFTAEDIKIKFFKIVEQSKLRKDLDKIEFVIENKFIRSSISAQLKRMGHYADSSFNAEIIRIHFESFIDLLEHYFSDELIEEIVKECKELVKEKDPNQITFKLLLRKYLEGVASTAGKKTVDLGLGLLTGGIDTAGKLIGKIKQYL